MGNEKISTESAENPTKSRQKTVLKTDARRDIRGANSMKIQTMCAVAIMALAFMTMPAQAQSRKEKKAAKKAQWEMEQRQKAEEAELLHKMRMDSIKRANEERAEAEERTRDRKRRREDQKDAMEQILEGGVQLIYTPCMDEFLALNKIPEQMAAQGIGTGQNTQELAQKVANERALDDIGSRFAGVVKNAMESYNKDTSTPKGNRVTEGSLEGMVISVGEKAINEFYVVECRQFAKDKYLQWNCYEALYVPMNKVMDAIMNEVKDVDIDKALFRKRMQAELDANAAKENASLQQQRAEIEE